MDLLLPPDYTSFYRYTEEYSVWEGDTRNKPEQAVSHLGEGVSVYHLGEGVTVSHLGRG